MVKKQIMEMVSVLTRHSKFPGHTLIGIDQCYEKYGDNKNIQHLINKNFMGAIVLLSFGSFVVASESGTMHL